MNRTRVPAVAVAEVSRARSAGVSVAPVGVGRRRAPRAPQPERLRVRYFKKGKIRFTSHRDTARIWERALRRAGLPVAYSGGFSPRPRVSFGLALPTGYESDGEYLDVQLDTGASATHVDAWSPCAVKRALCDALPEGMAVLAVRGVERRATSLQQCVHSCSWRIDVWGAKESAVAGAVSRALSASELLVQRQRKGRAVTENIRAAILNLSVHGRVHGATPGGVRILAELSSQPPAARPKDLLVSLDMALADVRVRRLHQWLAASGTSRREPLDAAGIMAARSETHQ